MAPTALTADPAPVRAEPHENAHESTPEVSPRDLVQFRAGDTLAGELNDRSAAALSPSLTIKRDVERYYALLASVRHTLPFDDDEIALVRRVAWDTPGGLGGTVPRLLWAEVSDTFARQPQLAEESTVDVDQLAAKLRDLGAAELYALVEKVECEPDPSFAPA